MYVSCCIVDVHCSALPVLFIISVFLTSINVVYVQLDYASRYRFTVLNSCRFTCTVPAITPLHYIV